MGWECIDLFWVTKKIQSQSYLAGYAALVSFQKTSGECKEKPSSNWEAMETTVSGTYICFKHLSIQQ